MRLPFYWHGNEDGITYGMIQTINSTFFSRLITYQKDSRQRLLNRTCRISLAIECLILAHLYQFKGLVNDTATS